ncbi:hypothetical protein [Maridesulfovibrio sp.]|uniref:tetratricopeptide repeat protein n=1 Tax=Maridesulfovibrio sp. TaxID=2795000 RepID=UPI0039EEB2F3
MDIAELLRHATAAMADEKYIKAEIAIKQIFQQEVNNTQALKMAAELALECDRPEIAVEYFERYIKRVEPDLETSLSIAEIFNRQNMPHQAGKLLTHALELDAHNAEANKQYLQHAYNTSDMDAFPYEEFVKSSFERSADQIYFHVVITVFGEEFTSVFVDDVLPTQFGPGNIESLNTEARSVYIIYTTPEDVRTIKKSAAFAHLTKLMDVRLYTVDFDLMDGANKYDYMIQSHKHALRKAHEEGARAVVLAPDAVFSESTFRNLYQRTKEGYKAVMIGTMRVTKEDFQPLMRERYFAEGKLEVPIEAREMVDMAISNLHPDVRNAIMGAEKYNGWPSQLLWEIPGEGILAHNFHLHPIMIHPEILNDFNGTIDEDCVRKICEDIESAYIVPDSDEMIGFDMSKRDVRTIELQEPFSVEYVAAWVEDYADEFHRYFMGHEIRVHNGKCGPLWEKTAQQALETVDAINNYSNNGEEHFFPEVLADYDLRFPPLSIDTASINCDLKLTAEACAEFSKYSRLQLVTEREDYPAMQEGLLVNMQKIRTASPGTETAFSWCCNLSKQTIAHLAKLAKLAAENGVQQLDLRGPDENLFQLCGTEFRKTITQIDNLRELAESVGIKLTLPPAWDGMVGSKLESDKAQEKYGVKLDIAIIPIQPGLREWRKGPADAQTRFCLRPWNSPHIHSDRDIHSCPVRNRSLARMDENTSLRKAMHSADFTDLRRQLITGNITDADCNRCQLAPIAPLRDLKRTVANMIRASRTTEKRPASN